MADEQPDGRNPPEFARRSSTPIQSPVDLPPVEERTECPECEAVDWDVQYEPSVLWECLNCGFTWTPSDEDVEA